MIYGQLMVNGTALSGDVTLAQLGGVDLSAEHIEALELQFGSDRSKAAETGTSRLPAGVMLRPVRFLKRIDGTTPLFHQALHQNARVDGVFKLFDNHPDSGETRHRFNVGFETGRVIVIEAALAAAGTPLASEWIELRIFRLTVEDVVNSTVFSTG